MLLSAIPRAFLSIADELESGTLMLVITATGILVVFIALVLLIVLISAYGKITEAVTKRGNKAKKSAAKPAASTQSSPSAPAKSAQAVVPAVAGGVSDEIIAVIAAAVASLDGEQYVVRSVRRAQPQGRPAWSTAGIMENVRSF